MKIALMILVITTFGCLNNDYSKENKIDTLSQQIEQENKEIIGSWRICKSIGAKGEVSYNKCRVIDFETNGTGKIIFFSKKTCNFKWKTENLKIIFSFNTDNDKNLFISNNNEFTYLIYKKDKVQFFELINEKIKHKFILSRSLQN